MCILDMHLPVSRFLYINHVQFSAVIPFKSEMAIELQEKGRVRFWAEVAKFTSNCQVEYVFNDNIIREEKVRHIRTF